MSLQRSLLIAFVAIGVGTASATVVPIGEFTGDMFEGFEGLGSPGSYPGPMDIAGGQAGMDDDLAHSFMIAYSLYSGITQESIYPYNGNLMGGSPTGWCSITFDTPVTDFGSYIGTVNELSGTTVTFKDVEDTVIDSLAITVQHPLWTWFGWHSDTPIARIEFKADATPGNPIVFDDVRACVPEPAALSLLLIGVGLGLRRR